MDLSISLALSEAHTNVNVVDDDAEDSATQAVIDVQEPPGPPPEILRRQAERAGITFNPVEAARRSARASRLAMIGMAYELAALNELQRDQPRDQPSRQQAHLPPGADPG